MISCHWFQYPLSGRRLCSPPWSYVTLPRVLFQYPLSGRRLCSSHHSSLLDKNTDRFSTLYRVEGCAASPRWLSWSRKRRVSVPSIGSKAVQHAYAPGAGVRGYEFQYPLSGRRLCSTLNGHNNRSTPMFQYPLSGRRLCSICETQSNCKYRGFQYPLSGRRLCSQIVASATDIISLFQYPLSGRRLCSRAGRTGQDGRTAVSVPSIGSKAVQQPRSRARNSPITFVSVPSIGSKAVQRGRGSSRRASTWSFSTLYRVEGCAALPRLWRQDGQFLGFSTLYRVEGCAARQPPPQRIRLIKFQYPLSGRRLCSPSNRSSHHATSSGFSTLYRVEGCAAIKFAGDGSSSFEVSVPSIGSKAVQHSFWSSMARLPPRVSVPSIGSKAVQLQRRQRRERHPHHVSVPSIGSKAVQRNRAARPISAHRRFSTLYRVEGCAALSRDGLW